MNPTTKLFITIFAFFLITTVPVWSDSLNVAVVLDGRNADHTNFLQNIEEELDSLTGDYDQINFPAEMVYSGEYKKNKTEKAIKNAVANVGADAVICIGPVSSHLLAMHVNIGKPAFSTQIINAELQFEDKNTVKRKGFNYINLGVDIPSHLLKLQQLKKFKNLGFITSNYIGESIPQLIMGLGKIAKEQGFKVKHITAKEVLSHRHIALRGLDAVYVAPLNDFSDADITAIFRYINAAKIPSLSMADERLAEKGGLVTLAQSLNSDKLARRVALNIQRLLYDEDPADFSTEFTHGERLRINMATARKIGIYPTWEQKTDAVLIDSEPQNVERQLSLTEVIETAVIRNLQLAAKKQEIEADLHSIDRARSRLKPQLSLFGRESVIDEDRADNIMTPAKYTTQIGADLVQVIYSEQANANIDIQKLMLAAKKEEERALILEIMKDAALAYLNVLKSKTLLKIQRDNLDVTRANLEIAKFRKQVGTSGPAEVYRWEIQMAGARQAVIDASVMNKKAELALNQLLNASQEEEFTTADCEMFTKTFFVNHRDLAPYIDNEFSFKFFRDFLVFDSFAYSPEIQQLQNAIKAQNRAHASARNRFSKPTVALQGNFTRTLKEAGPGEPKPPMAGPFANVFNYPDKNDWYVGINVSIPLHEGGDRPAAIREAKARIRQLENQLEFLMQRIELNTRISLEDTRSSFSGIKLSNIRAEYAEKSLDLVQSAYSRGAVNILDLIDAQNASLTAKEASANAKFDFFSDFVKVCRAVGTFDFVLDRKSHYEWINRLKHYFDQNAPEALIERKPSSVSIPEFENKNKEQTLYRDN
jgi:outer membrane protein TolC